MYPNPLMVSCRIGNVADTKSAPVAPVTRTPSCFRHTVSPIWIEGVKRTFESTYSLVAKASLVGPEYRERRFANNISSSRQITNPTTTLRRNAMEEDHFINLRKTLTR